MSSGYKGVAVVVNAKHQCMTTRGVLNQKVLQLHPQCLEPLDKTQTQELEFYELNYNQFGFHY